MWGSVSMNIEVFWYGNEIHMINAWDQYVYTGNLWEPDENQLVQTYIANPFAAFEQGRKYLRQLLKDVALSSYLSA